MRLSLRGGELVTPNQAKEPGRTEVLPFRLRSCDDVTVAISLRLCGSFQNDTPSNGTAVAAAAANRWHFPNQEEQVNADRCRSAVSHLLPQTVAKLHVLRQKKKNLQIRGFILFIYLLKKNPDRFPPQCPVVLLMLS